MNRNHTSPMIFPRQHRPTYTKHKSSRPTSSNNKAQTGLSATTSTTKSITLKISTGRRPNFHVIQVAKDTGHLSIKVLRTSVSPSINRHLHINPIISPRHNSRNLTLRTRALQGLSTSFHTSTLLNTTRQKTSGHRRHHRNSRRPLPTVRRVSPYTASPQHSPHSRSQVPYDQPLPPITPPTLHTATLAI